MVSLVVRAACDLAALVVPMAEYYLAGLALFGLATEKPDGVAGNCRVNL